MHLGVIKIRAVPEAAITFNGPTEGTFFPSYRPLIKCILRYIYKDTALKQ